MITGLDHVQVTAPPGSEDAARAFYGGVLGLEEVPKPAGMRASGGVWFRCGAQSLHVGIEATGFRPAPKAHPGFLVDDLDALIAGQDFEWDERIPGIRRGYLRDPFGNRVELTTAPTAGC